jgi:UDP-N-acetylmuramate dehydrogenase
VSPIADRSTPDRSSGGWAALVAALEAGLGDAVTTHASLAEHTTYRLGGPAAVLVRAGRVEQLLALGEVLSDHDHGRTVPTPVLVIGRGSNLLVADTGFPGVAVVLGGAFEEVAFAALGPPEVSEETTIRAGAAVALPTLARRCAAAGVGGLEFLVGIPGSVGGAVRMNAGGHGREVAEVLVDAEVVALSDPGQGVVRLTVDQLALGYRTSCLRDGQVVVGATFRGVGSAPGDVSAALAEIVRWRREHQPGGANAGSVFRNPSGDAAGRLIEASGCKGLRVGAARVSTKHANFFQAEAGATAADVHGLVAEVRRRVLDATGVELEPELRMVGFGEGAAVAGTAGAEGAGVP